MRTRGVTVTAHREIFSKSYKLNPKSDCIYHFAIDLESNGHVCLVPNQSENGKFNMISKWFNKISKRFLCVYWCLGSVIWCNILHVFRLTCSIVSWNVMAMFRAKCWMRFVQRVSWNESTEFHANYFLWLMERILYASCIVLHEHHATCFLCFMQRFPCVSCNVLYATYVRVLYATQLIHHFWCDSYLIFNTK